MTPDKGLPINVDAERFVLGSILIDPKGFETVATDLEPDDFGIEKHRRIFKRMRDIHANEEAIDRVTLANELVRYNELESVDGMTYINSLDDGLPQLFNIASYARIVKEKSVLRQAIFASQHMINRCLNAEEEPGRIISDAVRKLQVLHVDHTADQAMTPGETILAYPGGLEAFLSPPKGMSTGYEILDEMIYGLQKETLYVIGADASVGKSSLALNIADNVVRRGDPVAYFSIEMNKESLVRRMVASKAKVPLHTILNNEMEGMEEHAAKTAASDISLLPLHIDDSSDTTVHDFRRKTEYYIRHKNIKLAVVDYLQIMDWQSGRDGMPRFQGEREALTYTTRLFKKFSKDLGIPIILVSQLSRQRAMRSSKDLRPKPRDLHGSSSIEKDADCVMLVYRAELDKPTEKELRGYAELIVGKQRNGRIGTVHMKFNGEFTRFEEAEEPPPSGDE